MITTPCDFHFEEAVAGFFELPTSNARRILPPGVEPLERCHGQSVLAVLAFDFLGGYVGAFREIVLAILIPPFLNDGAPVPQSAMYPFLIGTSTAAAREHGLRHYHLPHHPRNVEIAFVRDRAGVLATVSERGPILRMGVTSPGGIADVPVIRHYQVLSAREGRLYLADVQISGRNAEHEEEAGSIDLGRHDFTGLLELDGVSPWAFREQRITDGTERYWPVTPLDRAV